MPQATDELRAEWGIDCGPVMRFLESAGYVLTKEWEWIGIRGRGPTEKEARAIEFLIQEWDFGGLVDTPPEQANMKHGRLYDFLWMLMHRRRTEAIFRWLQIKDDPPQQEKPQIHSPWDDWLCRVCEKPWPCPDAPAQEQGT